MIINLEKLSPHIRYEVCAQIRRTLNQKRNEILFDLVPYKDGPARDEMMGWADACDDVILQTNTFRYENNQKKKLNNS